VTVYGRAFDDLATTWRTIENEHDKLHPDRGKCGGVGRCSLMLVATRLEQDMVEALTEWRRNGLIPESPAASGHESGEATAQE